MVEMLIHLDYSALEIATKLCDAEFTRKAKAADFFSRTWDLFMEAGAGNGEDKVYQPIPKITQKS